MQIRPQRTIPSSDYVIFSVLFCSLLFLPMRVLYYGSSIWHTYTRTVHVYTFGDNLKHYLTVHTGPVELGGTAAAAAAAAAVGWGLRAPRTHTHTHCTAIYVYATKRG